MQIQINKIGLYFPEYPKEDENGKILCDYKNSVKVDLIAYYCPVCGNTLYGLWKQNCLSDEIYTPNRILHLNHAQNHKDIYNRYAENEKRIKDLIHQEIDAFIELNECPICKGHLLHDKGFAITNCYSCTCNFCQIKQKYTIHDYIGYTISGCLDYTKIDEEINALLKSADDEMASYRLPEDKSKAANMCIDTITNFSISTTQEFPIHIISPIKESPDKLINYIQNLINTENDIYSLQERLKELYFARISSDRAVTSISNSAKIKELSILNKIYLTENEIKRLSDQIDELKKNTSVILASISKPIAPVLATPKWYNRKSVELNNNLLQAEYQQNLSKYEKEKERLYQEQQKNIYSVKQELDYYENCLNELKQSLEIQNEAKQAQNTIHPEIVIKVSINYEIKTAEECLKKSLELRNELYGVNIIFEKYRNTVALCTLCEYLQAGRCNTLEGVNGAYNLYESEIRSNQIIDNLESIATSVDQINKNQYMIYRKMKDIKTSLNTLQKTMDIAGKSIHQIASNQRMSTEFLAHIAENSNYIAYNTAVTAYYSKINAHLTNSLGYLIALK